MIYKKIRLLLCLLIIVSLLSGCTSLITVKAKPEVNQENISTPEAKVEKETTKQDILIESGLDLFDFANIEYKKSRDEFKFLLRNKGYEDAVLESVIINNQTLNLNKSINNYANNRVDLAEGEGTHITVAADFVCTKRGGNTLGIPHIKGNIVLNITIESEIKIVVKEFDVSCT